MNITSSKGASDSNDERLQTDADQRRGKKLPFQGQGNARAVQARAARRSMTVRPNDHFDLGLRLEDIGGLEREPAAATKTKPAILREQLEANGATDAEIDILLDERVELNALTSDELIAMIERKLKKHGIKKVIPGDKLLAEAYRAFHHSQELREVFEQAESKFEETKIKVPKNLGKQVRAILNKNPDLRWDDALEIVLDETQLDHVREKKQKAKKKSGDFTETEDNDEAE
jgi:hypothetical protein